MEPMFTAAMQSILPSSLFCHPLLLKEIAMDVSSIASLATNLSAAKTDQQVGIAVLKKAMDIASAGATALISAIPSPANLPANLGQNINIAV
jgi:hypothetical protein